MVRQWPPFSKFPMAEFRGKGPRVGSVAPTAVSVVSVSLQPPQYPFRLDIGPLIPPSPPPLLAKPVLAFASATDPDSDTTQDFNLTVTAPAVDDVLTLQWDNNSDFSSVTGSATYIIITADLGDLTGEITTGALADGAQYFRAKHSRGAIDSAWSDTVTKVIDATAPTITSATTANNAENSVLAHALTANETVTWALNGGADTARFEISGSTLRWLSNGTKDYETPNDAGTNNVYNVTVRATDTAGNTTDQNIAITVTDVAEGSANKWNSADKGIDITLSGSDLIATKTAVSTTDEIVRATASASSGKYYWETTINAGGSNHLVGISTSSESVLLFLGFSNNGCGFAKDGNVYIQSLSVASIQTYANGDVVCVALDLDNSKIWFRTNGGNWNNAAIGSQNPATNTGGISLSGMAAGAKFASLGIKIINDQGTANYGATAFAQTAPSGFSMWP